MKILTLIVLIAAVVLSAEGFRTRARDGGGSDQGGATVPRTT